MPSKRQTALRKLGNAVTALNGVKFASGKWFIPPDKGAKVRVERWQFRCRTKGYHLQPRA